MDTTVENPKTPAAESADPSRKDRSPTKPWSSSRLVRLVSSLKVTVVFLALALILVFVATLAQVNLGIHFVQQKFFQSFLVWWTIPGTEFSIPVMPGGYLIGWVLVINLVCAHAVRFKMSWRKSGIFLVHAGLLLLLLGQFATGIMQEERQMRLDEGETQNYSEDPRHVELAILDTTAEDKNKVVAIPQEILSQEETIQHPALPFTVDVLEFFDNSRIGIKGQGEVPRQPVEVTNGFGTQFGVWPVPRTVKMNERDVPSAFIRIKGADGEELGSWLVSNFFEDSPMPVFAQSQNFSYNGRDYKLALRQTRDYKPFSLKLLDFRHERYPGTEIPKDFSSMVHLVDESTNTDRDVRIYMNNPLRYGGYTFFQASFANNDTTSILQVVSNPFWLTPYIACIMMTVGLFVQFGYHLVRFTSKRKKKMAPQSA